MYAPRTHKKKAALRPHNNDDDDDDKIIMVMKMMIIIIRRRRMVMMMMRRRRRRRRSSRGQNSRVAQARGTPGLLPVQLGRFHQRFDLGPLPLLQVNVPHVLWIKDVYTRAPCHLLANQATGKLPVALCQDVLQPIYSGCTCSGRQIGSRVYIYIPGVPVWTDG